MILKRFIAYLLLTAVIAFIWAVDDVYIQGDENGFLLSFLAGWVTVWINSIVIFIIARLLAFMLWGK